MTRNRENLDLTRPCRPATNFCEDRLIPLTRAGNPYRPGFRLCKNLDCMTKEHITQSRYLARKVYDKLPKLKPTRNVMPDPKVLLKIAKPLVRGTEPELCQVKTCTNPHRATNLCLAHYNQLYRYRQATEFKRIRQDYSDIAQYVQPVKGSQLTMTERHCHYPECQREYFARGLCRFHNKRWLRAEGRIK